VAHPKVASPPARPHRDRTRPLRPAPGEDGVGGGGRVAHLGGPGPGATGGHRRHAATPPHGAGPASPPTSGDPSTWWSRSRRRRRWPGRGPPASRPASAWV